MLHYIKLIFSFRHHHLSETRQLIYEAAVLELLIVSILSITAKIIHIISHFHTEYVGLWMDYNSKVLNRSQPAYNNLDLQSRTTINSHSPGTMSSEL